jgi:DNA repair protein RadC
MRTMKQQRKPKIKDQFIREVNVNYRSTRNVFVKISEAEQVAAFIRTVLTDNSREHCIALYLDGAHQIASYSIVSIGGANSAPLAPREVFQRAVLVGAISVILAHNHPSGVLTPSPADLEITKRMKDAGEILGITVLDHVILSDSDYLSMRQDSTIW